MGKKKNPLDKRMEILSKKYKKHGSLYTESGKKPSKSSKKKKSLSKAAAWKFAYESTLVYFQCHLYELICEINDIPLGIYVRSTARDISIIKELKLDDEFMEYSELRWEEPYPIAGLFFRGRFATCVLHEIIRKSHKIVKSTIEESLDNTLSKKKEMKLRYEVLASWITIIDLFVSTYLRSGQDYVPFLRKIEELLGVAGDNNPDIKKYIEETDTLLHGKEEPGVEANNITKLAFALATGSLHTKKCPPYDAAFDYLDDDACIEQVGQLGFAILKRRRKKGEKIPVLYRAFQKANPKITSRFYDINQEAPEITVGLRALEFSKLFYNNDIRSCRLIDRIM